MHLLYRLRYIAILATTIFLTINYFNILTLFNVNSRVDVLLNNFYCKICQNNYVSVRRRQKHGRYGIIFNFMFRCVGKLVHLDLSGW